jgi:hypothetical protein
MPNACQHVNVYVNAKRSPYDDLLDDHYPAVQVGISLKVVAFKNRLKSSVAGPACFLLDLLQARQAVDYVALPGSLALLSLWCLGTPGIRSTTSLS